MTPADIHTTRTELGLSQADFGRLLGYGRDAGQRVSELERGVSRPGGAVKLLLRAYHERRLAPGWIETGDA